MEMIRTRLGNHANNILTPDMVVRLQDEWEHKMKYSFNDNTKKDYRIDMGRAPDIPSIGLKDGRLVISMFVHAVFADRQKRDEESFRFHFSADIGVRKGTNGISGKSGKELQNQG